MTEFGDHHRTLKITVCCVSCSAKMLPTVNCSSSTIQRVLCCYWPAYTYCRGPD